MSKGWSQITDARAAVFQQRGLDQITLAYEPLLRRAQTLGAQYVEWVTARQGETKNEVDWFVRELRNAERGQENAASRAAAPSAAESIFSDTVDAEDAILRYLDRLITGRAGEDWTALDAVLVAGNKPVTGGTFVVGQWNMLAAVREAEAELRKQAMFYVTMDYQQSLVEPAVFELRREITGLNGKVYEPRPGASGFGVFQTEVTERIQMVVASLREKMLAVRRGPGEFPEEVRWQWVYIEEVVDRAARNYLRNDAIELYDLQVSTSQAAEMLKWLDEMNPYVPAKLRLRYEIVYRIVSVYVRYMGPNTVYSKVFYQPEQKMTETVKAAITEALNEEWKVMMERGAPGVHLAPTSGALLEKDARSRGLSEEWTQWREAERLALVAKLDAVKANPWSGPCAPNYDGVVVPFDAFREAEELYKQWVRQQVRDAFARLAVRIQAAETDSDPGFKLAADYAGVILNEWEDRFEHIALGDVRFRSIRAEQWDAFRGVVAGTIGVRYASVTEWEAYITGEGERLINEGVGRIYDRLAVQEKEMPPELAEFEELVRHKALRTMSDARLNELYDELRALELRVPPTEAALLRYETVVDAFRSELEEYRGGAEDSLSLEDAVSFAERHEQRLLDVYADVAYLLDVFSGGQVGTGLVASMVGAAMAQLRGECLGWTVAGGLSRNEIEEKRAHLLHRLEAGLDSWREGEMSRFEARFQALLRDVEAHRPIGVGPELRRDVEALLAVDLSKKGPQFASLTRFKSLQDDLRALYESVVGKVLGGAVVLEPFAHFNPLKSRAGVGVEAFTDQEVDTFIAKWAAPRLEGGLYVESKVNGYRAVAHVRDGEVRLLLEEDPVDRSGVYVDLARELSALPDVVLDGELIDRIGERLAPDVTSGRYKRSEIDDADQVLAVFDILYVDGKSLAGEALDVRRRKLREFLGPRDLRYVVEWPVWYANTEAGLREAIDKAAAWEGSEGAMVKAPLSTYAIGATTVEWAKLKRTEEVRARVLKVKETVDAKYVYECGLVYQGERDLDRSTIRRSRGGQFVVVGATFGTGIVARAGDVVLVRVSKVARIPSEAGLQLEWQDPVVVKVVDEEPDTVGRLVNISNTLSASITQPYRVLRELEDKAAAATQPEVLATLATEVFEIYRGLNFPRLRTLAWAVYEMIEKRLSELGVKGGVTDVGAAKVTLADAKKLETDFSVVELSKSLSPSEQVKRVQPMLDVTVAWLGRAEVQVDDTLELYVAALAERMRTAIEAWGGAGGLTAEEIKRQLSTLGQKAYDATKLPVSDGDRVRTAIEVREATTELMSKMGRLLGQNPDYGASVSRIFAYVEQILKEAEAGQVPEGEAAEQLQVTYERVVSQLAYWAEWLPKIVEGLQRKDKSSHMDLESIARAIGVLKGEGTFWIDKLTVRQRAIFSAWIDELTMEINAAFELWKTVMGGGAVPTGVDILMKSALDDAWNSQWSFHPYMWDEYVGSGRGTSVDVAGWVTMAEGKERARAELATWADGVDEWTMDESELRDLVEAKVHEVVAAEAASMEKVWRAKFGDVNPEPLGTQEGPGEEWVSPLEKWKLDEYTDPYVRQQLDAGNSVLLRKFEEEPARVLAIVAPDGTVLAGNVDSVVDWRVGRMLDGLKAERATEILGRTEALGALGTPPADIGVETMRDAVRSGARGTVEVVGTEGGGNGYFGGFMGDGRPFFVSAKHVVEATGPVVRLPNGQLITCEVVWDGGDQADLVILVAPAGTDVSGLVVLQLGTAAPGAVPSSQAGEEAGQFGAYGVAISAYWEEADMVNLMERLPGEPAQYSYATETERWRGGYSGAPIVDATGRVVGLVSKGIPVYGDADRGGYSVTLAMLQWAYQQAGVRRIGGAQPFADRVFMGTAPKVVPVPGELVRVTKEGGVTNLLLSFDWDGGPRHEVAVLVGGVEDKLFQYRGGKLIAAINEPLAGQREVLERVALVPSRMRTHRVGNRYYEFYLTFERHGDLLNGLWCLTEDGALDYGAPFFLFRLKGRMPFWVRHRKDAEALGMPLWQKPVPVGR